MSEKKEVESRTNEIETQFSVRVIKPFCCNCRAFDDEKGWFECNNATSLFFGQFEDTPHNRKLYKECGCNKFEAL